MGINPGLWTAASGAHFAYPGNRFYPALARSGILDRTIDPRGGFAEDHVRLLTDRGIAITNLVQRTTARADELDPDEFVQGVAGLERKVSAWEPRVVAFVGLGAYRTGYGRRSAKVGTQDHHIHGAEVWALPNPSGLNAHYGLDRLAELYGQAAEAAGIELDPVALDLE